MTLIQPRTIVAIHIKPSTEYDGMTEMTLIDEKGGEYYMADTPCGRILLRKKESQ